MFLCLFFSSTPSPSITSSSSSFFLPYRNKYKGFPQAAKEDEKEEEDEEEDEEGGGGEGEGGKKKEVMEQAARALKESNRKTGWTLYI